MKNILDTTNKSLSPTFGKNTNTPKRLKFQWERPTKQGEFCQVHKNELLIDGAYQRDQVSKAKVMQIARTWDWLLFGTLSIVQRATNELCVFDGGHRVRASFYRDDITTLPAMVHAIDDIAEEARAFVAKNTLVSAVSAMDRYKASITAGEDVARAVSEYLTRRGINAQHGGATTKKSASCIGTLIRQWEQDAANAEACYDALLNTTGEQPIPGRLFEGLCELRRRFLGAGIDVLQRFMRDFATKTPQEFDMAIRQLRAETGKGGQTISARAILRLLNKGKRNKLPWFSDDVDYGRTIE